MKAISIFAAASALAAAVLANAPAGAGPVQTARMGDSQDFAVAISTACNGTTAVLRITNRGEPWPAPAVFRLSRTGDGSLVSERRMRLKDGQTVSFNVRETDAGVSPLRLEVVPSWPGAAPKAAAAQCVQG
jgi:hypothetical protein